jgi:ABC-2 type transport system permease protein
MTHIVNAYRDILYYQQWPDFVMLGAVALFSFGVMILGYLVFRKLEKGFAEEL